MYKKFKINQRKIKGGCQQGRKVVTHNSKSDLPLGIQKILVRFSPELGIKDSFDLVFFIKNEHYNISNIILICHIGTYITTLSFNKNLTQLVDQTSAICLTYVCSIDKIPSE